MSSFHIAQINIAQAIDDMESEAMKGFVERLDEINSLADGSPGFVWRLQTDEGDATSIQVFEDPRWIVNMSVWKDIDSLKHFVYRTSHVELIQDREAWFNKIQRVHQALWWVPEGHIPSEEEGKGKLSTLQEQGPSPEAFTFARPYSMPGSY